MRSVCWRSATRTSPWPPSCKRRNGTSRAYRLSATWIPPLSAVQTLADRVSAFGTLLDQGEERTWVGAPLTVHRRCDEPMFSLCNQIAYNGIMVNGVHRDADGPADHDPFHERSGPVIAPSHWADEPVHTRGTHRRLYVVGDHAAGAKHNYFHQLALTLTPPSSWRTADPDLRSQPR